MVTLELKNGSGVGPFNIRNLVGHEPCHDFNPVGTGKRMCALNKSFDILCSRLNKDILKGGGRWRGGEGEPADTFMYFPRVGDNIVSTEFSFPLIISNISNHPNNFPNIANYIIDYLKFFNLDTQGAILEQTTPEVESLINNVQNIVEISAYSRLILLSYIQLPRNIDRMQNGGDKRPLDNGNLEEDSGKRRKQSDQLQLNQRLQGKRLEFLTEAHEEDTGAPGEHMEIEYENRVLPAARGEPMDIDEYPSAQEVYNETLDVFRELRGRFAKIYEISAKLISNETFPSPQEISEHLSLLPDEDYSITERKIVEAILPDSDLPDWFGLVDLDAAIFVAQNEVDRGASGRDVISPQLQMNQVLEVNEILMRIYVNYYNTESGPFVSNNTPFIQNGMVLFFMACLSGNGDNYIVDLRGLGDKPSALAEEIWNTFASHSVGGMTVSEIGLGISQIDANMSRVNARGGGKKPRVKKAYDSIRDALNEFYSGEAGAIAFNEKTGDLLPNTAMTNVQLEEGVKAGGIILNSTDIWVPFDENAQEETFSYYTPVLLYWLNKGIACHNGEWNLLPNNDRQPSKSDPDAMGCMEECKNKIAEEIKTVIIPNLFEVFGGMIEGTATMTQVTKDMWSNIKDPLKEIVTSTLSSKLLSLGNRALFGAAAPKSLPGRKQSGPVIQLNQHVFKHVETLFLAFTTSSKTSGKKSELGVELQRVKMEESQSLKAVSIPLRNFTNTLLKNICGKLKNTFVGEDGVEKAQQNNKTPGGLYYTEGWIIDHVAEKPTIGDIDGRLMNSFLNSISGNSWSNSAGVYNITNYEELLKYINNPSDNTGVTNNALGTKIARKNGKDVQKITKFIEEKGNVSSIKNGEAGIDCQVTSVLDAMGAFGSCFKGRNSVNYQCMDMDVSIDGDGFTFGMTLNGCASHKVVVNYSLNYSSSKMNNSYSSGTCTFESKIGTSAVNVLSANNTMQNALDIISLKSTTLGFATTFDELFQADYKGGGTFAEVIMTKISDKYMGDFGQGLSVIAQGAGGQGGVKPNFLHRAEADGDRPSFVRNAVQLLSATIGTDPNSKLLYTFSSGSSVKAVVVNSPNNKSGGGRKRTRRKQYRPRKTCRKGHRTKHKHTRVRKRVKKPTRAHGGRNILTSRSRRK
jgi:hypothetical protein